MLERTKQPTDFFVPSLYQSERILYFPGYKVKLITPEDMFRFYVTDVEGENLKLRMNISDKIRAALKGYSYVDFARVKRGNRERLGVVAYDNDDNIAAYTYFDFYTRSYLDKIPYVTLNTDNKHPIPIRLNDHPKLKDLQNDTLIVEPSWIFLMPKHENNALIRHGLGVVRYIIEQVVQRQPGSYMLMNIMGDIKRYYREFMTEESASIVDYFGKARKLSKVSEKYAIALGLEKIEEIALAYSLGPVYFGKPQLNRT